MVWSGPERRSPIAIGVMCKAPRPGFVKTRLAASVGNDTASLLATAFIKDAFHLIDAVQQHTPVMPFLFYAPVGSESEFEPLVPSRVRAVAQIEGDLGAIMSHALSTMLNFSPAGAILMGSDIPTLPAEVLVQAVTALRWTGDRAVIGPASDGGYYLIGIKSAAAQVLFEPMPWGTPAVLAETRSRARRVGLEMTELGTWYDVDDAAGLVKLKATLAVTPGEVAPATRAALS